jgi:hypothetical protein
LYLTSILFTIAISPTLITNIKYNRTLPNITITALVADDKYRTMPRKAMQRKTKVAEVEKRRILEIGSKTPIIKNGR